MGCAGSKKAVPANMPIAMKKAITMFAGKYKILSKCFDAWIQHTAMAKYERFEREEINAKIRIKAITKPTVANESFKVSPTAAPAHPDSQHPRHILASPALRARLVERTKRRGCVGSLA